MTSQSESLFSCRIVASDYYLRPPVNDLDACFSDLTSSAVERVPVIRIFGATPAGQKCCLHIHGVFPYIHVPCRTKSSPVDEVYLQQLARSIDSALQLSSGTTRRTLNYVYKIIVVKGIPFYGYHKNPELFLRIYLYNPAIIPRLADLLAAGAVMQQPFQPHDAHIPFILQFFIDFHLYGMNFVHLSTVKFRIGSNLPTAPNKPSTSMATEASCEPDAHLMSSHDSCDLSTTPSQKLWSMEDLDWNMISNLSKVSTCELECDGLAVNITNKTATSLTSEFSDNPGIAALWQDEKVRREWKDLTDDLIAPPSPERICPEQCFDAERQHKQTLHQIIKQSFPDTNSSEEDSDPSLDSMMMSQSCDLMTHLQVGSASQEQQSVAMATVEPVVDIAAVEYTTQLSQRLSQATMTQCSDQELLDLLRQLGQDNDGCTQQNNVASQVISSSQLLSISPSVMSNSMSPHNDDTATPPWGVDETLTPNKGAGNDILKGANDTLTPSKRADDDIVSPPRVGGDDMTSPHREGNNDISIKCSPQDELASSFSLQSDSILFQDSQHSGSKEMGRASDGVQLTTDQRVHVISLCSHGDDEDLQLDNTYHTSFDDNDIIDDIIEHEDTVMSQPWNSGDHLEHQPQQTDRFVGDEVADIEDLWSSSFINHIPQLDGTNDEDPREKYSLRKKLRRSYLDMIKYKSHTSSDVRKPFKPPRVVSPTHVTAHQTSHNPQTRLCDDKVDSIKFKALKRSLFPRVKRLTTIEIASIKDSIKQQQQQLQMEVKACTTSDHSSSTTVYPTVDKQLQEGKRRPSLSLKRKQKEDRKRKQRSPMKMRSRLKKISLSEEHQQSVTISPYQFDCTKEKVSTESTLMTDEVLTSRYHELQFATEGASQQQQQHTEPQDNHHCYNDSSDALVNMGYLSPSVSTHVDSTEISILQSPFKSSSPVPLSPVPICRSPHLDTSFSLELRSSSSSSSPPRSSSPCSARNHSPSPSPTSHGDALQENLQICHQPRLHVESAASSTTVGSCELILASSSGGSCDQEAATPTDNDAISCISESPKSKLPRADLDAIIPMDTSDHDACIIAPAVAPPTSAELLDSLQQYGQPDIVYQQPFCSVPTEVPPVKHVGSVTVRIPSKMVYELPEFQPTYTIGHSSFASTGIAHWRTVLSMLSGSGEGPFIPSPPSRLSANYSIEQYQLEGKQRSTFYSNKHCVITPAKLPPDPKLLNKVEDSHHHCSTSTPMVNKAVSKKQPVSLTPIKTQTKTEEKGSQSLDHSELSGPTLGNTYGFKISPAMGECTSGSDHHKVQYLTVLSVELHVTTRGGLKPDPQFDAVMAVCYHIRNDWPTNNPVTMEITHEYTGVIVVTMITADESCSEPTKILNDKFLLFSGLSTEIDILYAKSEQDLFHKLVELVRKHDVDILIGYEVQMSSWGYLVERAATLDINLTAQLSRVPDTNDRKTSKLPASDVEQSPAVEFAKRYTSELSVVGRVVLNIWRIVQQEVALTSYTFENVFYHVLHQRTPQYSHRTLSKWYTKGGPLYCGRVLQYYLLRSVANYEILDKFSLIGRTSEFARLYGILFYSVLSRGSQFRVESMLLRLAKPRNYIAVSPTVQQRARMAAPESLPLILEPESRFYADPVVVLDFQSLYPSIVIAYNYCFSTCLGRVHHLEQYGYFPFGAANLSVPKKTLKELEDQVTISPNGVVFVKRNIRRGIMPCMLEEILNTRVMVKQSMKLHKDDKALVYVLDARQLGLKLIANVTFGYTAASYSGRMPCVEISDSIISKARETLNRAIQLVNSTPRWGGRVVYGDTDSLFVMLKGANKEDAFRIGKEIVEAVTADNPKPVKLKFEKVYLPCVLQTKKRYVGYAYETIDQKEPIFDAKGIETVRRDGCPAVVKVLERSIKLLFDTKDISRVKSYITRQCGRVLNGRASIGEYTFAREYRGRSSYRPGACVPALELTREALAVDPRSEPRVGERVPYVIIHGPPGLPLIRLVKRPMDVLHNPTLRLNGEYYVTKQILPPLDRVFSLVGVDVTKWYYELPRVFRVIQAPSTVSKGTIGQYFATIHCCVCGRLSVDKLCTSCTGNPQKVAVVLNSQILSSEKSYQELSMLCSHCVGSRDEHHITSCTSIECPVLSRRLHAHSKLLTLPETRTLLDNYVTRQ